MTRRDKLILTAGLGTFLALLIYHGCAILPDLAAVVGLH